MNPSAIMNDQCRVQDLRPVDALSRFAIDYFTTRPPFCVPRRGISVFDGILGTVLYRKAPFQVQLFISGPHVVVPGHLHPNVDSYEVALTGVLFRKAGQILVPLDQDDAEGSECSPFLFGCTRVKPSDWHGGQSGPHGGAFISVQQWAAGLLPTCVSQDWLGHAIGQDHAAQLGRPRREDGVDPGPEQTEDPNQSISLPHHHKGDGPS